MAQQVEVGIYVPQVGFTYDELLERARWIEEFGFHSMWLFDHLYFEGLETMPTLEGWTLATALLAATTRLQVGHMVLCNNFRHPALLGKMAATADVISGGRLLLGLGSGSIAQEHAATGLPWGTFAERTSRLEESLEIITRMFDGGPVTYEGKHFSVSGMPAYPLPVQRPRPPIVLGGGGERTLDLVARFADWWNCPTYSLSEFDDKLAALHAACARHDRDPATLRVTMESVLALAPTEADVPAVRALAERRFGGPEWGLNATEHIGTPATVIPKLREAVDKGVTLFVFFLHDRAKRETLELIAKEIVPAIQP